MHNAMPKTVAALQAQTHVVTWSQHHHAWPLQTHDTHVPVFRGLQRLPQLVHLRLQTDYVIVLLALEVLRTTVSTSTASTLAAGNGAPCTGMTGPRRPRDATIHITTCVARFGIACWHGRHGGTPLLTF